jgi:KTSC domain-containing protein
MRRGTLKSDLIKTIGYDENKHQMEVEYTDGTIFLYSGIQLSTFRVIVRSKNPGTDWIAIRGQYKFEKVKA